jgi:uncharacterized membrane protein YgcG
MLQLDQCLAYNKQEVIYFGSASRAMARQRRAALAHYVLCVAQHIVCQTISAEHASHLPNLALLMNLLPCLHVCLQPPGLPANQAGCDSRALPSLPLLGAAGCTGPAAKKHMAAAASAAAINKGGVGGIMAAAPSTAAGGVTNLGSSGGGGRSGAAGSSSGGGAAGAGSHKVS